MLDRTTTARRPHRARRVAFRALLALAAGLVLSAAAALADTVSQTASDAVGESSLTQGARWGAGEPSGAPVAGTPPTAGYDYANAVAGRLTRTPTAGDLSFAGDSLSFSNAAQLQLLNVNATTTINDLRLDNGIVEADAAVGANSVTLAGTVTVAAGGGTFRVADPDSTLAIAAALVDPAVDTAGDLTFTGTATGGTIRLDAAANTYTGATTVTSGRLTIWHDNALGATATGTTIDGTGALVLSGGISTAEPLTLLSRAVDPDTGEPAHVYSVGNNTLAGPITLSAGSDPFLYDTFAFGSLVGTLTVAGDLTADATNDYGYLGFGGPGAVRVTGDIDLSAVALDAQVLGTGPGPLTIDGDVNLSGGPVDFVALGALGGDMTVNGKIDMTNTPGGAAVANLGSGTLLLNGDIDMSPLTDYYRDVYNAGSGTTVVNGRITGADSVGAYAGKMVLGAGADVSGTAWIFADLDAIVDATAVVGGLLLGADQELFGDGTLEGDVVALDGSMVDAGWNWGDPPGHFTITGDLDLKTGSRVLVDLDPTGSGSADLLTILGELILDTDVLFDFNLLGALDDPVYIFMTYGSWDGSGNFDATNVPSGYEIRYGYQGNTMALVPGPAPWALVGLGALGLAGRRRLGTG
ncbi:hypothetical protein [Candidatus Thiodictyon syntrophicum]|jgi:hypothetical protein|uniref:PEP-CTERM protein-sorting domain-containing protein n=1 Tax=Candidatus Thiodictyon syntrophicum TaxID=1166950 RepID=A0A2K8U802_9GAMM|nr:hypothetical protein [Candidatus Thiodictyon syntrophicum]AUB81722.1 hypothetical protein THSYN_12630 [Candidatus Thiodictyon syntrophicum]